MIGLGTIVNVLLIVLGGLLGLVLGGRFSDTLRTNVMKAIGLVVMLLAAQSVANIANPLLRATLPAGSVIFIVLGALVLGTMIGTGIGLQRRTEQLGDFLHTRAGYWFARKNAPQQHPDAAEQTALSSKDRFVQGFLTTSLIFAIGPLSVIGSLNDGMGRGATELFIKGAMDGISSVAFAAAFGAGVLFSAASVGIYQGAMTILGWWLGSFLPETHVLLIAITGGLLLLGISFQLLEITELRLADMLPALFVAPLLTEIVIRGATFF